MLVCACVVLALMYEHEGTHAYRAARRERSTRHSRRGGIDVHGTARPGARRERSTRHSRRGVVKVHGTALVP